MNLIEITNIIGAGDERVVEWFKDHSLIANPLRCGDCRRDMSVVKREDTHVDGVRWRCSGCSKRRSLRTNSFFVNFPKIPLKKLLLLIYLWASDERQVDISKHIGLPENEVSIIVRRLRAVCSVDLQNHPIIPFGGGHAGSFPLKCDESKFNHKRKANRGRHPSQDSWVFGIVTTEFTPARGYFEVVERRDRETLHPIINRCVVPGSEVHTDDWGAYRDLEQFVPNVGSHRVVVHKRSFVDPLSGVHTQDIESCWNRLKERMKRQRGSARHDLQAFLDEQMWRDWRNDGCLFNKLIAVLASQNPNEPV